jgi:TP901 family phage tail tape measure protein
MIDNLTGPTRQVNDAVDETTRRIQNMNDSFKNMTKTGVAVTTAGVGMAKGVLSPVGATFETKKALGELASVGVENLKALEDAAIEFSNTWSGTTKSEFISAAYDIKSGISSLADEGVAEYTKISALTAKATKSSVEEMTSLFATGYGIYKDFYSEMSDIEFAELFSAGIAKSVQQFKTDGSKMSQAIQTLGAAATSAQVPLEEQLSILGMLQATMSGGEAGTKYRAFLKSAAKAGEELGLKFTDANNQLLSMPEILGILKNEFGETLDAAEKLELQKAFGTEEAVALIDLLYNKTNDLQGNIVGMHKSMSQGTEIAEEMASVMNKDPGNQYELLKQQAHNLKEELGNALLPTAMELMRLGSDVVGKITQWATEHKTLTSIIMKTTLAIAVLITFIGGFITVFGVGGMLVTSSITNFLKFKETIGKLGPHLKDGVKWILNYSKSVAQMGIQMAKTAAVGIRNFALGIYNMARQAIIAGLQALPGLIASVWSFTAALLANPITWVVVGVVALIAGLYLLWKHFDKVSSFVSGVFNTALNLAGNIFNWIREKIEALPQGFKILLAAIFPFISIPMMIIQNWEGITNFFGNLVNNIVSFFTALPTKIKNAILEKINIFKDSGKKIMETLGAGIKSAVMAPVNAVKNGLAKVRNLLPFSDAKEGPLSQLTLSGKKVFQTLAHGMNIEAPILKKTTQLAFAGMMNMPGINTINTNTYSQQVMPKIAGMPELKTEKYSEKISLEKENRYEKINLKEIVREKSSESSEKVYFKDQGKKIVIEKLEVKVENIKEVSDFINLIRSLEDQVEANGDD